MSAVHVGPVHFGKQRIHLHQSLVDHLTYGPQRMIGWNEVFQVAHRKQTFGEGVGSAHRDYLAYVW